MKLKELKEARYRDGETITFKEDPKALKDVDGFLINSEDILTWIALNTNHELHNAIANNKKTNNIGSLTVQKIVDVKDGEVAVHDELVLQHCNVSQLPVRFKSVYSIKCEKFKIPLNNLEGFPDLIKGIVDLSQGTTRSLEGGPTQVYKSYLCDANGLTSLKGAPERIGLSSSTRTGDQFYCSNNNLTDLVGGPNIVYGSYDCSDNNLVSLKGAPDYVRGYFDCSQNPNLKNFEHAPGEMNRFICNDTGVTDFRGIDKYFEEIHESFYFKSGAIDRGGISLINIKGLQNIKDTNNHLTEPFEIINKYIGRPEALFECQSELIEAGYEEYAEL